MFRPFEPAPDNAGEGKVKMKKLFLLGKAFLMYTWGKYKKNKIFSGLQTGKTNRLIGEFMKNAKNIYI